MLKTKRFTCNMLAENCYVVSDETKEAAIIDCGALYEEEVTAIFNYIDSERLKPVHLLCTHGHFDHCMGNGYIFKKYRLKPEVHLEDKYLLDTMIGQTKDLLGVSLPLEVPPLGKVLSDSDTISFGYHTFKILHTPGHTPGGIVFYCEDEHIAFSGDTLFRMSIGRTDFERGSYEDMMYSLKEILAKLPSDVRVFPGHGPETTIGDEVRYNPYMR